MLHFFGLLYRHLITGRVFYFFAVLGSVLAGAVWAWVAARRLGRFVRDDLQRFASQDRITPEDVIARDNDLLRRFRPVALAVAVTLVAAWLGVGLMPMFFAGKFSDGAGTFGDAFGFVNALFSALALAGVVLAVSLQTIEVRYQRQEIAAERKESEKQTEVFAATQYMAALSTLVSVYSAEIERGDAAAQAVEDYQLARAKLQYLADSIEIEIPRMRGASTAVFDRKLETWIDNNEGNLPRYHTSILNVPVGGI